MMIKRRRSREGKALLSLSPPRSPSCSLSSSSSSSSSSLSYTSTSPTSTSICSTSPPHTGGIVSPRPMYPVSLGWDTWHPSTIKNTILIDDVKELYISRKAGESSFFSLPCEVQIYIFSFLLEEKHLGGIARVCKRWRNIVDDGILWRMVCKQKYGCMASALDISMHSKNHVRFVGQRVLNEMPGRGGDTALHREIRRVLKFDEMHHITKDGLGGKEVLVSLIEHKRDVNAINDAGVTPLHLAAEAGCIITAQILVEHGANVNAVDKNELSSLHLASSCGHKFTVEWLVKNGANVNAVDSDNRSALHWAAHYGHQAVVQLLVNFDIDVNIANSTGNTALHFSALFGFLDVVKVLVSKGAKINARNSHGDTPASLAARNNQPQTHRWLIEQTRILDALASNQRPTTLPLPSIGDEEKMAELRSAAAAANASASVISPRSYSTPIITRDHHT